MARSETGKTRAQRIQLDYHKQPDALLRWRRWMIVGAIAVAGAYGLYAAGPWGRSHINTGPLSWSHASLEHDCEACHGGGMGTSLGFDAWRPLREASLDHIESSCQSCHPVRDHFRLQLADTSLDRSCTRCHREHLGRDHNLMAVSNGACTDCHGDLTSVIVARPHVANTQIQEFTKESHGEFRSLQRDPGRIRFDHRQHMRPGQVLEGTRGGITMDRLPPAWRAAYRGMDRPDDTLVQLECGDCHVPDQRQESALDLPVDRLLGQRFQPVSFDRHCGACHALNYASGSHDDLPLPHAAPWAELRALLGVKLAAGRSAGRIGMPSDLAKESTPGRHRRESGAADPQGDLARSEKELRARCLDCHRENDLSDEAIARARTNGVQTMVPDRWFQTSVFDHSAHAAMHCEFCHQTSGDAKEARPSPTAHEQVMIRGIDSCALCHRPSSQALPAALLAKSAREQLGRQPTWASDRCTLCHRYHWTRAGEPADMDEPAVSSAQTEADQGWLEAASGDVTRLVRGQDLAPLPILGFASCASATCHGGIPGQGPTWNSSVRVWEARDPHATAGLVLMKEASRAIAAALDPRTRVSEVEFLAFLQRRCVSCHVTLGANPANGPASLTPEMLVEGVSCESCHGPASHWIDTHLRSENHGENAMSSHGMRDTKNWLNRLDGCARCHIGSRSADGLIRDMNHDLVAAGHPALRFDGLAHSHRMPPHWDPRAGTEGSDTIRLHRAARWRMLARAAQLSRERSTDSLDHPPVPQPEFSDYDCFACHHPMQADRLGPPPFPASGRGADPPTDPVTFGVWSGQRGLPRWNPWYTAGLPDATRMATDLPLSSVISKAARQEQLAQWSALENLGDTRAASEWQSESAPPMDVLKEALANVPRPADWYDAAILYLTVRAATADTRSDQPLPEAVLEEIHRRWEAMAHMLLPFERNGTALECPGMYSPEAFHESLKPLRKILKPE